MAETYGAISLYEKYRLLYQQQSLSPLSYPGGTSSLSSSTLIFEVVFRRRDSLINQFHAKRSRIAPTLNTDRGKQMLIILQGERAPFHWTCLQSVSSQIQPIEVPVDPPYDLLLQANAVILGPHQDGKTVLILQEMAGCDLLQMAQFAQWKDGKCAGAVRAIALATQPCKVPMCAEYIASATDQWQKSSLCSAPMCPKPAQGP